MHDGAVSGSPTPSVGQALHISSQSPSVPKQPELYSEGRLTEGKKGSPLTDSKTTSSGEQALHVSSQSPSVPKQPELYSEGRLTEGRNEGSPLTDSKTTPGSRALLDVSSTPDMSDVDELVVTEVAANWQRVALRLGVEGHVSEAVLRNRPNDSTGACQDMLNRWLRRDPHTGEEERTWSTLLTALGRAGFEELERRLQREHFHKAISP